MLATRSPYSAQVIEMASPRVRRATSSGRVATEFWNASGRVRATVAVDSEAAPEIGSVVLIP